MAAPERAAVPPAASTDFGSFYNVTLLPLRNYLARILGSRNDAQDIAQDAYMRTYEAMHDRSVDQPKAYLYTVARRLALNYRERRADRMIPTEAGSLELLAGSSPGVVQEVIARQQAEALDAAILRLPPACQRVLILRLKEGLSHDEIAKRLGIASNTVGNHLSRAFRLLREFIPEASEGTADKSDL